jgi:hypothetical protein
LRKRSPSQAEIAEFKDLTKKDAATRLETSLKKLVSTAQPQFQKVCISIPDLLHSFVKFFRILKQNLKDLGNYSIVIYSITSINHRSIGKKLNHHQKEQ